MQFDDDLKEFLHRIESGKPIIYLTSGEKSLLRQFVYLLNNRYRDIDYKHGRPDSILPSARQSNALF